MGQGFLFIVFVVIVSGFFSQVHAEGTRQLEPYDPAVQTTEITRLYLDYTTNNNHRVKFAQVGCAAQYRLNIYIGDPSTEKIYIGLNDGAASLYYQLRDPDGLVVPGFSLTAIPTAGTGYIYNYSQAYNGPNIGGSNPSGYTPIVVTPVKTGNYYLEFASDASGSTVYNTEIKYFDVTVAQGTSSQNGRLWSKAWQIYSGGEYSVTPPTTQCFTKFYIYTDDGIVSRLDMNGLCGGEIGRAHV